MIETLRCPACHAAYGLRPERVHPGIRRAQCARCPEIFDITEAVARLLAPLSPPEPELLPEPVFEPIAETFALPESLDEPTVAIPLQAPHVEAEVLQETAAISPEDLLLPTPMLNTPAEALDFLEPLPEPEPLAAPQDAPSLTLHDLEGTDEEILDKTLLMEVMTPETKEPEATPSARDAETFSSAKDAISRILGGLDAPAGHAHPHAGRMARSQGVDMEATLSALDKSLGAPAEAPAPAAPGTATTVRISLDDIRAAIDAVPLEGAPAEPAPETAFIPQPMPVPTPAPTPAPVPEPLPTTVPNEPTSAQDPNLLKVQVGNEVYTNVTVEQLTQWIEQGRILENHQVARQFSDNWIDAVKVPALRPAFDRVRRARIEVGAPMSVLDAPQKKSLFGGLFGR